MKCGLIVMGDLPTWKKYEVWSHCKGMTNPSGRCDMTSVKDRTYLRSPEGMAEEGLENLVLPDNSRS